MAAICIGGVCVPYTAVLPLLALALKWLAAKLATFGLLPKSAARKLGLDLGTSPSRVKKEATPSEPASSPEPVPAGSSSAEVAVREIDTIEDWEEELSSSGSTSRPLVAKFTADWCKPCKAIDPFFCELATKYNARFVRIDVDELDELAAKSGVAMMPTFVVFAGREKKGSLSGANEDKLERMIREHCSRRVRS
mmetsp:Transcript_20984/g.42327  ORF Transcript_20984/g.42327 Transcript_20984/m.42327 type:complete len:194 (-) Transcript_20984:457-1038(-)